jgi:hypothetical protein
LLALLMVVKLDAHCFALAGRVVLGLAGAETSTSAGAAWMAMEVDGFASHASSTLREAPWSAASRLGEMAGLAPREELQAGTVRSASFLAEYVTTRAGYVQIALGMGASMGAVGTR